MPTIKTKKEMNLPQLIEWGFENDIRNARYIANNTEGYLSEVSFEITGLPIFSSMVDKQDTFTVEIEEEITEDTVFKQLIEASEDDLFVIENGSINTERDNLSESFYAYINGEIILIWTKEKGLV
ncbi:hypothetical protein [Mammaliicoccus sciuri]|uniref:hypothetical protein n=1 Tax=Mammaliicoccus sciuri TaxID=1296 RepID=UPI0007346B8F|nr:hypothetical protein [Mammaliicoccus sciuri]